MKNSAVVINAGRGSVVDENSMRRALGDDERFDQIAEVVGIKKGPEMYFCERRYQ